MKLQEFTTITNDDLSKIVYVQGRVSDHSDPEKQKEWITFRFAVELPTVRNGAILRREVLQQASEKLRGLSQDFERIVDQDQT